VVVVALFGYRFMSQTKTTHFYDLFHCFLFTLGLEHVMPVALNCKENRMKFFLKKKYLKNLKKLINTLCTHTLSFSTIQITS
jgi:hypothetical protein